MDQGLSNLNSMVQVLTLKRGLHLISVTAASPRRMGDDGEVLLPAMHIGAGPGLAADQVEIVPGPRGNGGWLCEVRDMLVVKVNAAQAPIFLTTFRDSELPALEVEVTPLDRRPAPARPAPAPAPAPALVNAAPAPTLSLPAALTTTSGRVALSVRVDLHVQQKGDVSYVNNFWAGALGERLAIEAFAISPLEGLDPGQIEYAGVAINGDETGWVDGGGACGTRGMGVALAGFAVRLKPDAAVAYECEYRGSFRSGHIVGPLRGGAPCHAEPGDPLEAIQLFIVPRAAREEPAPPAVRWNGAATALAPEPPPPPPQRRIGPRFSIFRDKLS